MSYLVFESGKLLLKLYVQSGARESKVVGLHGDRLEIKLVAAPVEGKANLLLMEFLSQTCLVPKREISLIRGEKSRFKDVWFKTASVDEIREIFIKYR